MKDLFFRKAAESDEQIYLEWANDAEVRRYSFNQEEISSEKHHQWFQRKIKQEGVLMLVFFNAEKQLIGQVRIEAGDEVVIGVSVATNFRGKGLSAALISHASNEFLRLFPKYVIFAYIKSINISSIRAFEKAGYKFHDENKTEGFLKYIFTQENA